MPEPEAREDKSTRNEMAVLLTDIQNLLQDRIHHAPNQCAAIAACHLEALIMTNREALLIAYKDYDCGGGDEIIGDFTGFERLGSEF